MLKIDTMIKCRALFLQSVAALNEQSIIIDDEFDDLLNSFFDSYINKHFDKFSLLYCFKIKDGKVTIHEEKEWLIPLNKYLNYFIVGDTKNVIKLYDDIGYDNVRKISELAELFYNYIIEINESNMLRIKS